MRQRRKGYARVTQVRCEECPHQSRCNVRWSAGVYQLRFEQPMTTSDHHLDDPNPISIMPCLRFLRPDALLLMFETRWGKTCEQTRS